MTVWVTREGGTWRLVGPTAAGAPATGEPTTGQPLGPPIPISVADLGGAAGTERVVWASTAGDYPVLRRAGVRVARCHDLGATEALLLGHEGRCGEPRSAAAAAARLTGAPVPPDPGSPVAAADVDQAALFDAVPAVHLEPGTIAAVHADQEVRIRAASAVSPGFPLLVAAESAATLAAVEMSEVGLPWDAEVHDRLLTDLLGPRPVRGARPAAMARLAERLAAMLDTPDLNPDSQPELLRALRRAGLAVRSTSRWELRGLEHPVIPVLTQYRELARLFAANGWAWREQWVRDGRFRPEYVPGGVVSGRWATRGGGALQIPRAVRGAVVAGPGRTLVVADAGQLEPRVLAAMSRDPALVAATRAPDLYTAVARSALGSVDARGEAKIGLLAAMYGGGAGSTSLHLLRHRFPTALALLERAARTGEDGGSVRSVLGRTSPPAATGALDAEAPGGAGDGEGADGDEGDARAARRRRAYGRFTRNFVVQASAADWASVLVGVLRARLHDLAPGEAHLVFFQHDEVIVEAPAALADRVVALVGAAGDEATRLVLGDTGVRIPLPARAVRSYADADKAVVSGPAAPAPR